GGHGPAVRNSRARGLRCEGRGRGTAGGLRAVAGGTAKGRARPRGRSCPGDVAGKGRPLYRTRRSAFPAGAAAGQPGPWRAAGARHGTGQPTARGLAQRLPAAWPLPARRARLASRLAGGPSPRSWVPSGANTARVPVTPTCLPIEYSIATGLVHSRLATFPPDLAWVRAWRRSKATHTETM